MRDDATCWLNLGDSYTGGYTGRNDTTSKYESNRLRRGAQPGIELQSRARPVPAGLKPKDLIGVPWRVAFALQADGWWLRSAITWCKRAPMPESVQGSHYSRHCVTIEEYERLSRLREEQRREQSGIGDLPDLPTGEVLDSQTSLSAERERQGDGEGTGRTPGRERETAASLGITTGATEQSQVRSDGEGQGNPEQGNTQISGQRPSQGSGTSAIPSNEGHSLSDRTEAPRECAIPRQRRGGRRRNVAIMRDAKRQLFRRSQLQPRIGWRSSAQHKNRCYYCGKRRKLTLDHVIPLSKGGLHVKENIVPACQSLQFQEGEQTSPPLLVECPGCPKSEKTGGYILHMSAGRPSSATEMLFLLTKNARYFYDSEAVKVASSGLAGGNFGAGGAEVGRLRNDSANARPADNGTRNLWNYWVLGPEPLSIPHFAAFPTALVEPCIKAGTSQRGACPQCGSPWVRCIEQHTAEPSYRRGNKPEVNHAYHGVSDTRTLGMVQATTTTGWRPTCECDAGEPVPATVLDPFFGAGTTGLVADRLGRDCIGIDLSSEYAHLAEKRIAEDAGPMIAAVKTEHVQAEMFG